MLRLIQSKRKRAVSHQGLLQWGQTLSHLRLNAAGPVSFRSRPATQTRGRCCGGVRAQEDGEYRTGAGGAFDIKKAAVTIEDVLNDCEPQSGSAHIARARGVDAVEALGQARQVFARDTLSTVAHGYRNEGALSAITTIGRPNAGRGGDRDLAGGAAVFDAVVDEILKNLGELVAIAQHVGQIGRQV